MLRCTGKQTAQCIIVPLQVGVAARDSMQSVQTAAEFKRQLVITSARGGHCGQRVETLAKGHRDVPVSHKNYLVPYLFYNMCQK